MIITISKWSYFKMLKKTLIASAIAAVSFGSMAANTASQSATAVEYASELFGAGASAVELKETKVRLNVHTASGAIAATNRADLTVTLKNGTFASDVRPGDFTGTDFSINSIVSGGKVGDNTVKVEIETSGQIGTGVTSGLTFAVNKLSAPSLASTATGARVTADLTLESLNSIGANPLPNLGASDADPVEIAKSSNAATFSITGAQTDADGLIDKDDNTKFNTTDGDWNASQITFSVAGPAVLADGTSTATAAELFQGADVSFEGTLNDGDVVKLDDAQMEISGNVASYEVPDAETINNGVVNYKPAGEVNLVPSAYTNKVKVSGKNKTTKDLNAEFVKSTSYAGQNEFATINAVPSAAAADIMNIRLTNKSSKDSQVFFRVKNLDGTTSGTFQLLVVGGNETTVITPAMLEEIAGTFTGRPNIEFSSAEEFEVLAVMRSNGTLTSFDSDQ
jgi:hypothetical protein